MNPTSLYVSTSRVILRNDTDISQNLSDLYILVPYLRQSLSCAICNSLLMEPFTSVNVACQHHVCKLCIRELHNSKPWCPFCKKYDHYRENLHLRILLQCYKSLCQHVMTIPLFNHIRRHKQTTTHHGGRKACSGYSLVEFIEEGARFHDNFKPESGLQRSEYSMLPCVFTHNGPKQSTGNTQCKPITAPAVSNGSAVYSVLYTGIGNKIKIKRKFGLDGANEANGIEATILKSKSPAKRYGCRCGNAAITPGKLTCCGQRCPCYVEAKSCANCKCRGCRNPHRQNGAKVAPKIEGLKCYGFQVDNEPQQTCVNVLTNIGDSVAFPQTTIPPSNGLIGELSLSDVQQRLPTSYAIRPFQDTHVARNGERGSILITSERNFKVVNVIAAPSRTLHNVPDQDDKRSKNSTDMPQQQTFIQNVIQPHSSSVASNMKEISGSNSSIFISNPSSTINFSPIIVNSTDQELSHIYLNNAISSPEVLSPTQTQSSSSSNNIFPNSSVSPIPPNNFHFQ